MPTQETGQTVLVVDDNQAALASIKILLEMIGLKVRTMHDGEEAIEEIKNHKYDLLIFDVSMPGIDGVDLFRVVRESEGCRDIPVMFTSGFPSWSEPEEQRREILNRAEAYMQKPFNTEMFYETIRRLLKTQQSIA
jgi:chemosensory pili system protein ChpA (sensor histidine kinase/response regulator)